MKFRFSKVEFRIYSLNIIFLFLMTVLVAQNTAWGKGAISGQELAQQVFDRKNGDDVTADMSMILINKSGHERIREFVFHSKDFGDRIKQFNQFTSPADIKGTGFLSVEKEGAETEQFLYLPSLRRTRRIVSTQKSRSYVNSDFSYEDMERRPVENFEHRITGEENISDVNCTILESKPKEEVESQYGWIKNWIDPQKSMPLYMEYFDKKEKLIKKYRVVKLERVQNIWTEMEVVMEDLKRKHKTVLKVNKIIYNTGLDDRMFTRQYLENF